MTDTVEFQEIAADSPDAHKTPPRHWSIDGPPDDWTYWCAYGRVIDEDSGEDMGPVVEVDCDAGWLIRLKVDANGRFQVNETGNDTVKERIEGRFRVELQAPADS